MLSFIGLKNRNFNSNQITKNILIYINENLMKK